MILKEFTFKFQSHRNGLVVFNVTLTTVDHGNISKSEGDNATSENIDDVRSFIPARSSSFAVWR
jgi:hypothetical protein